MGEGLEKKIEAGQQEMKALFQDLITRQENQHKEFKAEAKAGQEALKAEVKAGQEALKADQEKLGERLDKMGERCPTKSRPAEGRAQAKDSKASEEKTIEASRG